MAYSDLDQQQILQRVFNEETNTLHVVADLEAQITVPPEVQTLPARISISDFSQYISDNGQQVLSANPSRAYLVIQNASQGKIWIEFDKPAAAGFPSLQLNPNQTLIYENNCIPTDAIYAIASVDSSPLIIKEGM